MNYTKFSAGEYQLMKEEHLRQCTHSDLGIAINKTTGCREPAIVLRHMFKNKESLLFRDITTSWTLAQESNEIELIILNIEFKAADGKDAENIKIFIDKEKLCSEVMDWFQLLITTSGELALNDASGDVQAIMITGVPLDLPRAVLAQAQY